MNAVLAGSVGLNKTTSGAATVNAPTYTGTTTDSSGTLTFTGGLPGGNYVINGGTLNINALIKNIGAFQIASRTLSGTGTLTSSGVDHVQGGTINAVSRGFGRLEQDHGLERPPSATPPPTPARAFRRAHSASPVAADCPVGMASSAVDA